MHDHTIWAQLGEALFMAAGMFWDVGWSLVLGFTISAAIQAFVSTEAMRRAFGRDDARAIALATAAGAVSSSCSYASAAISRSLFKKGAALIPSLAFLFASTNLVIELGIILYLLMGWQFTAAEWIGGVVLVVIMTMLVRLTYPAHLVEEARDHPETTGGHTHEAMTLEGGNLWQKLRKPETRIAIAQNFAMDATMLWKDLFAGFLIAGVLAAFVPNGLWEALFLKDTSPWVHVPVNALLGPLIAVVTFVCSIGNVPMAAVLWGSGISFGGVLAFLYADLIVIPLLDVYRRYYGWRMASYIFAIFYATMVLAGLLMDVAFTALGLVPPPDPNIRAEITNFSLNYTFWLNLIFGALAVYFFWLNRWHPMQHSHPQHGEHNEHHHHP
ncbi:MAG TPA: permease [Alphaproteobacteria bacterium]|nr:permease [Alphaproteobacteria bacterium]